MAALSIIGFDYSFSRPDPAALVRAGGSYVVRYGSHDAKKNLSRPERDQLWAHGLAIALVFEDVAGRALLGKRAGQEDAKLADTLRHNLGMPDVPWYFAVDQDTGPAQWPTVASYFQGAEDVLGHAGVGGYVEYDLVGYLSAHKVCSLYWQPAAWSRGLVHPAADMYQRRNGLVIGGGSVDLNVADTKGFFGAHLNGKPFHAAHVPDARKLAVWRHHLHEVQDILRTATLSSVTRAELQALAGRLRSLIRKG